MNKLEQLNSALASNLDIENVTDTLITKAFERLESTIFSLAEQRAYKAHGEFSALHGEDKAKSADIWGETERQINTQLQFGMRDVIEVAKLMLTLENIRADDNHHIDAVQSHYSQPLGH